MVEGHVVRSEDVNLGSSMIAIAFLIIMLYFPSPWSTISHEGILIKIPRWTAHPLMIVSVGQSK